MPELQSRAVVLRFARSEFFRANRVLLIGSLPAPCDGVIGLSFLEESSHGELPNRIWSAGGFMMTSRKRSATRR